jgi:hypothetical protein
MDGRKDRDAASTWHASRARRSSLINCVRVSFQQALVTGAEKACWQSSVPRTRSSSYCPSAYKSPEILRSELLKKATPHFDNALVGY